MNLLDYHKISHEQAMAILRNYGTPRAKLARRILELYYEYTAQSYKVSMFKNYENIMIEFTNFQWKFDIGIRTIDILHTDNRKVRLTMYNDEIETLFMLFKDLQRLV